MYHKVHRPHVDRGCPSWWYDDELPSITRRAALCRRDAYLGRAVIRPQALRRGAVHRRAFLAARAAVIRLQAAARGALVRRRLAAMHSAATVIQARFRGFRIRNALRRQQVSLCR